MLDSKQSPETSSALIRALLFVLSGLLLLTITGLDISTVQAEAHNSAYDLITAVNQLRVANGLPEYQINSILMSIAKSHSDYQASIGSITHTGSGGTRPRDRAVAAGYGGGSTVYVSENIAGGSNLSIQEVMQMWQGDNLHLNTLLGGNYQDVGAGIATSSGMTYYTLDVGYITGSPDSTSLDGDPTSLPADASVSSATQITFYSVALATPRPDGAIIHVVQPGQTLWSIAAAYKIELSEILELNGLGNNAWIFPGDKLLVQTAQKTNTPKVEEKSFLSPTATKTKRPTRTPKLQATEPAHQPNLYELENGDSEFPRLRNLMVSGQGIHPLLIVIAGMVIGGVALILVGNTLKRK